MGMYILLNFNQHNSNMDKTGVIYEKDFVFITTIIRFQYIVFSKYSLESGANSNKKRI